jgi:hypothetical protein
MSTEMLHYYRRPACTLDEALAASADLGLQGFGYAPARFVFLRWSAGALETGRRDDRLDQIYEARLFEPEAVELRWLRDPNADEPRGTAVLLSERALTLEGWQALTPQPYEHRLDDADYLGTPIAADAAARPGWWRFDAPRHGTLELPLAQARPGQRLLLRRREYLGRAGGEAGRDGNRQIIDTRLLAWDTLAKESHP